MNCGIYFFLVLLLPVVETEQKKNTPIPYNPPIHPSTSLTFIHSTEQQQKKKMTDEHKREKTNKITSDKELSLSTRPIINKLQPRQE